MKFSNPWIGYAQRSYEQMMQAFFGRLPTAAPEITDYSYSNPFIKSASVFMGVGEHLNYYIDARAREAFLTTCRDYASAVQFARLVDYRVHGLLAASVDLQFFLAAADPAATVIPLGTVCRTKTGIEYRTTAAATLPAGQTSVTVPARNWKAVTALALGSSDGTAGQTFTLGSRVVDNNVTVSVGGTPWAPVETFAFSSALSQHYRGGMNEGGNFEVVFGDGASGAIPATAQGVVVTHYTSDGAAGNVAANNITELSGLLSPGGNIVQVRNPQRAAGGTDAEGLEQLRKRIPLSLRTLERAVTRQDYIDLALLAPGVAQVGLVFSCGKYVELYVAPAGGGVASSTLLDSVAAYFEQKRMVTTSVSVSAAGEVRLLMRIDLRVAPNYFRSAVLADARQRVLAFLSVDNQVIGGSVEIGDVYQVLENTEGVEYSRIELLTTIPYARPLGHARALVWDRAIEPDSIQAITWRLTLLGNNTFELVRSNVYVGSFPLGQEVSTPELTLTVLPDSSYQTGDAWEFVAYPYTGSIRLAEQSVPVAEDASLTITATGGLV